MTITGGCLCGAVRYEAAEELFSGHCFCDDCRRSSSTAHGSHMGVARAAFSVTGEVRFFDKPADSGNIVSRGFCPTCGSPVYSLNSGFPDTVFLRASSLDDMAQFHPQMSVYASRAPAWDQPDASLPQFAEMPPRVPEDMG